MIGGHLLHGGDYNPEQWIEYPEILEEDLKLMNKANVNCVTLGVFSWAELELAYTKVSRDASGAGGRYGKPAGEAP